MPRNAAAPLAEIAARPGPLPQRAQALLDELRHLIPFDAAWLALAEPGGARYTSVASTELDSSSLRYLSGPRMAHDIETTGANRARPPISLSDLPSSAKDLPTWAECLTPAGFREALSVALFEDGGRHVGFVTVLFRGSDPPAPSIRRTLDQTLPELATGIDPVRSLAASALFVGEGTAGAVLLADRSVARLPGLPDDELMDRDSDLIQEARRALAEGRNYATFLWPRGDRQCPDGYARVTLLGGEPSLGSVVRGMVMLSPARRLRGLTPRELEVLGLVIDGCSNGEIARTLVVAPRTVAAHIEHILFKLDAGSRTLAAIRAERAGLYVPPLRSPR